MKIDIITIFPDIFNSFFNESLLARAIKKKLISIKAHNLRKWTNDNHKTVDDRPYGGGAGMVLKVEPIFKAVQLLAKRKWSRLYRGSATRSGQSANHPNDKRLAISDWRKTKVILLSAKGKQFTQKDARRLAKYNQLIFICGRYEGVDERVAKYVADEEISVGPFVLFGGEVPAMTIIEAVSRLIPGVMAKEESVRLESFSDKNSETKEHPQYTRPEIFIPNAKRRTPSAKQNWRVPKVLLSGDHKKIASWRKKNKGI